MMSHIEYLCVKYEYYRHVGLSVDADETIQVIQEQLERTPKKEYERLVKDHRYVHVFSKVKPREEAHGVYEND